MVELQKQKHSSFTVNTSILQLYKHLKGEVTGRYDLDAGALQGTGKTRG